ncbi:MAG: hypothetical protein HYS18_07885 [Burkholderiales bacterium]|nr:hypothetical protein [Burkholderiales bacterium]
MSSQIQIKFDALPGSDRKRLVKSLNNPACKIFEETRSNLRFYSGKIALILLLSLFLFGALSKNFGNPMRDDGWTGYGDMAWYAIWTVGIVYVLVACWRRYKLKKLFGFAPGRYLLPSALIDARSSTLKLYDLMQLTKLDATHHHTNGSYNKTSFALTFNDAPTQILYVHNMEQAEYTLRRFDELQNAAREAFDDRDMAAVQGFDPLLELRKNKWTLPKRDSKDASDGILLSLVKHPIVLSILLTALITPVLWAVRNAAGDLAMHKQAQRLNTEEAYGAYIARGKFYVNEMRAALPRVAFEEVLKKKSVTALRQLLRRYPDAGLQDPVAKEIHALYQKALTRFKDQAVQSDGALVAAMEKLLAIVEQRGDPFVPINFVRPTANELVLLDALLQQQGQIKGVGRIIPAAIHFGDNSAAVREARIVAGLKSAFQTIFPNDVLSLGAGNGVNRKLPTLDIHYQIDPSGSIYTSDKRDRGFVGLVIRFQSALVVSDADEQWRFNLEVQPPQTFHVEYKKARDSEDVGPEDSQVYAVMAERAFDTLASKITTAFFKPDSQAVLWQVKQANQRAKVQR